IIRYLIVTCFMLLFLNACSLSPREDAKRAQVERACIDQCQIEKTRCEQRCANGCKLCEKQNDSSMLKRYKDYIHEQCVQGERVALQLQSFRDPLQCRKVSCDCSADHRVCVSTCRGKIRKYLQVTPFCC
ncbi:MAG: hypothetical protein K0U52_11100, partial [Gammaproteobacteria bacterium]|nr:hypothetical protein [Gammaproteobacteria bacterium]